jgi:hypothetical protein
MATAWLTFHWLECRLVYGNASMAFPGDASRIARGQWLRRQACGFAAATSLKRP